MARLDRTRFITLVALLLVAAPLAGCLDRARQPGAPQLAVDGSTIRATNVSADAGVVLYDADTDTRLANATATADGVAVFPGVTPGRYYATQSLFGREGPRSNVVEVVPPPGDLLATGGVERVDVTGAEPGAALTLYDSADAEVDTETADDQGEAAFTGVEPGTGYYVTQTVGGLESDPSNAVDVQPPAPLATGGTNRVTVTDARPGAEVRLYDSGGNIVDSGTAGSLGGIEFTDVSPGTGYTATQVVNGVESPPSPAATVTGLQAVGGVLQVTINAVEAGATVTLYQAADPASPDPGSDAQVNETTTTSATSVVFGDVEPGRGYYATQTLEGDESQPSNTVNVKPEAPDLVGGEGQATATNFTANATLTLYGPDGNEVTTVADAGAGSFVFTGLDAGVGYTATQTVNDVESDPSNEVSVTGVDVPAPVMVSPSSLSLTVRVTQVFDGATVTLYRASGQDAQDPANDTVVNETVASGNSVTIDENTTGGPLKVNVWYYATQTFEGNTSAASNTVQARPELVGASSTGPRTLALTGRSGATYQVQRDAVPGFSEQATDGDNNGLVTFTDLEPATDYRARQWVHVDYPSPFNASLQVVPRVVEANANAEGRNITVVNVTEGADVTLYRAADPASPDPSSDDVVNQTAGVAGGQVDITHNATGAVLTPAEGYYATQTVNGSESAESLRVTLRPEKPVPVGAVASANVTGRTGANFTLYDSGGTLVANTTDGGADDELSGLDGFVLFVDLAAGTYEAAQKVNAIESERVPVTVEAPPTVRADPNAFNVTSAAEGATLALFHANETAATDVDGTPLVVTLKGTKTTHEFRFLEPGSYYVNHTDPRTAPYVHRSQALPVEGLDLVVGDFDGGGQDNDTQVTHSEGDSFLGKNVSLFRASDDKRIASCAIEDVDVGCYDALTNTVEFLNVPAETYYAATKDLGAADFGNPSDKVEVL